MGTVKIWGSNTTDWQRVRTDAKGFVLVQSDDLKTTVWVQPHHIENASPAPTSSSGGTSSVAPMHTAPRAEGLGRPTARTTDPDTSHEAAQTATGRYTDDQWLVLGAHVEAGARGLIGSELAEATGRRYESVGPRRPALERAGLIRKAGRRPNPDGNAAQVYVVTHEGMRAWRAKVA